MKKFFNSFDGPTVAAVSIIVLLILGTIGAVFDQKFSIAADYILMIMIMTVNLMYRRVILNYRRIVKSYENLVDALEDQSKFRGETINLLKKLVEMRNETITQLESEVKAKSVRKNARRNTGSQSE